MVLQSLPHHKRLGWLQAQEERTEWVTKFRESTKTGKVVMEVFEARDPHWVVRAGKGSAAPAAPAVRKVATNTPSTSLSSWVSQSAVGRWLKC